MLGAVLTLAMAASFSFQYALAVLSPHVIAELGISRFTLGSISAVYYIGAALTSWLLGGRMGSLSSRAGLAVVFGSAATASAVAAAAPTVEVLFLAAVIAGSGSGLSNPVTNLIIAAQRAHRGLLIGVKQAGVQVAAVFVGSGLPLLAAVWRWRGAFLGLSLILLVLGVGLISGVRHNTPPGTAIRRGRGSLPGVIPWLWGYAFFMGAGIATITTYLVLYAHDDVGFSPAAAGLLLAVMGIGGATTRVLSSVLADRGRRLDIWMAAAAGIAVVGVALFMSFRAPWALWLGVGIVGISGAAWNGIAMLAVIRITSLRQAAHATGVVLTGFFIGLSLGPPVFGAIVDAAGSYVYGWSLTTGCFVVATLLAIGMGLTHGFAGSDDGVDDADPAGAL